MPTVRDVKALINTMDDDDYIVSAIWDKTDVLQAWEDMWEDEDGAELVRPLTDKEINRVLFIVDDGIDAEFGVGWEDFNNAINKVLLERTDMNPNEEDPFTEAFKMTSSEDEDDKFYG